MKLLCGRPATTRLNAALQASRSAAAAVPGCGTFVDKGRRHQQNDGNFGRKLFDQLIEPRDVGKYFAGLRRWRPVPVSRRIGRAELPGQPDVLVTEETGRIHALAPPETDREPLEGMLDRGQESSRAAYSSELSP